MSIIEKELQNTLDAIDRKLSQGDRITDLEYIQLHQMRAKAEEKLRAATACNLHDDLLAISGRIVAYFEDMQTVLRVELGRELDGDESQLFEEARELLAKAGIIK